MDKEKVREAFRELRWQATYILHERGKNSNKLLKDSNEFDEDFRKAFESLKIQSGKVLDIGCGFGKLTLNMAMLGLEVFGVDISEDAITRAKRNATDSGLRCRFLKCDFLLENFSEKFDIVTDRGCIALITCADQDKSIKKVCSVLNDGGYFFLKIDAKRKLIVAIERAAKDFLTEIAQWESHYERSDGLIIKTKFYIFMKQPGSI